MALHILRTVRFRLGFLVVDPPETDNKQVRAHTIRAFHAGATPCEGMLIPSALAVIDLNGQLVQKKFS